MDDDFVIVSDTEEQKITKKTLIDNLRATLSYGILIGVGVFVSFCGLVQQFIAIDNEMVQQFLQHFWFRTPWWFWAFWLFAFIFAFIYVRKEIKNKFT